MGQVVIGGLVAIFGGFLATWYQATKARKIRIDEIMAEKQVEAWRQAHNRITRLKSMMIQRSNKDVCEWIGENEEWFFTSIPFLPNKFVNKWLSIRKYWRRATRLSDSPQGDYDEEKRSTVIDEICECESHCEKLAEEALAEIERNLGIEPIRIEKMPDTGTD